MWTVVQGCSSPVPPDITAFDPVLTQNPKKAGRSGRKQRKIRRANDGKKHKSEPKQLRFVRETTYGPEGRGFESLTAYQKPRETWFLVAFVFPSSSHKSRHAGEAISGDDMKYEDPQMEAYWNSLPAEIQAQINASGIDLCSLGMLMKLGDYYKNNHISETSQ